MNRICNMNMCCRCTALHSVHIPAFMAILRSAMTVSPPHTLHHKAHANHQRQLLSSSYAEQYTSAALENMRADISSECSFPVLYTGCGAAQCVCLSASNMFVVSLRPTTPLTIAKTLINTSAIVSARFRPLFCTRHFFTLSLILQFP